MSNIYLVTEKGNLGKYDSFDSFVIVCKTEEIARNTHPGTGEYKWWNNNNKSHLNIDNSRTSSYSWVDEKDVPNLKVEHIGVAKDEKKARLVCSSFNEG